MIICSKSIDCVRKSYSFLECFHGNIVKFTKIITKVKHLFLNTIPVIMNLYPVQDIYGSISQTRQIIKL